MRVQRLHAERAGNPILAGALDRLADWQARRLRVTYADLAVDPRYAAAIQFFQNDLYGAADFSRRDADLARIVPMMVRVLPESVVMTAACAMEFNGLSQELDRVLLKFLPRADGYFSVTEYCKAYRRAGNYPLRHRQIKLIVRHRHRASTDRPTKPLIRTALAMMRQPARLAGLSALQDFLERGFAAFRGMDGAATFLATIHERETQIFEAIVEGATDPFPDPLTSRLGAIDVRAAVRRRRARSRPCPRACRAARRSPSRTPASAASTATRD